MGRFLGRFRPILWRWVGFLDVVAVASAPRLALWSVTYLNGIGSGSLISPAYACIYDWVRICFANKIPNSRIYVGNSMICATPNGLTIWHTLVWRVV